MVPLVMLRTLILLTSPNMLRLLLLLFAIPMVQMLLEKFSKLGLVSLPSFDGKEAMVQSSRQTHHSPPPLYEISLRLFFCME